MFPKLRLLYRMALWMSCHDDFFQVHFLLPFFHKFQSIHIRPGCKDQDFRSNRQPCQIHWRIYPKLFVRVEPNVLYTMGSLSNRLSLAYCTGYALPFIQQKILPVDCSSILFLASTDTIRILSIPSKLMTRKLSLILSVSISNFSLIQCTLSRTLEDLLSKAE